jgi:hypothetical protein
MINITIHQRNMNQNHIVSPHSLSFCLKKAKSIKNAGEEAMEKREPLHTADGYVNSYSHYENS